MKKTILMLLTSAVFGISCEQDDPPTAPAPEKYISVSAGSTWNYELVNNVAVTTTPFTLTATSKDSTVGSRAYRVFTNSSGSGNEYQHFAGNDYYSFRRLPASFGSSSVEYNYLKDNVAQGASWVQNYPIVVSGFTLNATLTNTITAKGLAKTVKGTAYQDVIHVTTTVAVTVGGAPLPAGSLTTNIQSFYAPKLGLIQSINKVNINFSGIVENTDQQTDLISANIK